MPKKTMIPDLAIIPHDLDHKQIITRYLDGVGEGGITRWINESGEGIKIDDVRALIYELSYGMSNTEAHTYVLLHAESASIPAQNALLKTLEEPPARVRLVLTAASSSSLLPTIVSRCQLLSEISTYIEESATQTTAAAQSLWQAILVASSYSDLIAQAESIKEREAALSMVRALISNLYGMYLRSTQVPAGTPTLAQITDGLQILHTCATQLEQNANVRLALEHCFFSIHDAIQTPK